MGAPTGLSATPVSPVAGLAPLDPGCALPGPALAARGDAEPTLDWPVLDWPA
jgi:hypothetical protein